MGLEELFVNGNAIHQANIDGDEEGTVAAVATAFPQARLGTFPFEVFVCDRPFMFFIHDQKSEEILFAGVYRGPINNSIME